MAVTFKLLTVLEPVFKLLPSQVNANKKDENLTTEERNKGRERGKRASTEESHDLIDEGVQRGDGRRYRGTKSPTWQAAQGALAEENLPVTGMWARAFSSSAGAPTQGANMPGAE